MKSLDILTAILLVVGGLNWGLVAFANFDLVAAIRGEHERTRELVRDGFAAVGRRYRDLHDALAHRERYAFQHEDHVIVDHLDVVDGQQRPRRPVPGAHCATFPSSSRAACS